MKAPSHIMKMTSLDKIYRFTDALGNEMFIVAHHERDARNQYRSLLIHIDRIDYDRACRLAESVTVEQTDD